MTQSYKPQPVRRGGLGCTIAILLAVLLAQTNTLKAQDDNWWPTNQTAVITDCITDPDVNGNWPEPPDPSTESCDRYDIDLLERPMIQGPTISDDYFPHVDIDTVWVGSDATWLYLGVGIRGLKDGHTIDNRPMFEIDIDDDDRSDYLIVHEGGKYNDDFNNGSFTTGAGSEKSNEALAVWFDTDGSIGAIQATSADGPVSEMNGYETEVWKSGDDPSDGCRVRILDPRANAPSEDWARFEFACRRSVLGNLSGDFNIRATMSRGIADNQNFYLHDKYDEDSYGSPYTGNAHFQQGNTYEIDNTDWSSGTPPEVLPVEMTRFEALVSGSEAELVWSTASEENNAGFAVEHARGDDEFDRIAFVDGAGTTDEPQLYAYSVADLAFGRHRFRLVQIDFDGTTWLSPVVEVSVAEVPGSFVLEPAYPNPFNPTTTVSFGVETEQPIEITMYDVLGQRVKTLYRGTPAAGTLHRVAIDASDLTSGVYQVVMKGDRDVAVQTVTLLK